MRSKFQLSVIPSSSTLRRNMHLGQIVVGSKARYRLRETLKAVNGVPTVFEAEVLQNERRVIPARRVIVKTAASGHEASRDSLIREYNTYQVPSITTSRYIRTMYDVVGNPTELNDPGKTEYPGLVLEWFDTTLQELSPKTHRQNLALLYTITHAVLYSSLAFYSEGLVNTDIKPDNILISNIGKNDLVVKVGDLGSVHNDGEVYESQPFAMRSPEVWRGLACEHRSEVWAFAAMLLVWMKPDILGISGRNGYVTAPIWCIAKLMRLFPGWEGPPSDREFCRDEFDIATMLSKEPDLERPGEQRVKVAGLEEEMESVQIPVPMRNLLRFLLVPEPKSRPSAPEALSSEEYLALRKAALTRDVEQGRTPG